MVFGLGRFFSNTTVLEPAVLEPEAYQECAAPPLIRPTPVPAEQIAVPQLYRDLAESLDFEPAILVTMRVKAFLIEQQIPIYDHAAVDAYLEQLVGEGSWYWRPMRQSDKVPWHLAGRSKHIRNSCYLQSLGGIPQSHPYPKLIPAHILRDVKLIEEAFKRQVAFFVTELGQPDPFIMVTSRQPDGELIVFGAWDEPGFGVI